MVIFCTLQNKKVKWYIPPRRIKLFKRNFVLSFVIAILVVAIVTGLIVNIII
ncbi:hypothetical protein V103_02692 [Staphylococcus aureus 22(2K81-5)]|uniref:Uncharacterized protein n=1 Tax=Staphylococcus aureus TaxID=1280 RepID=A0A894KHV4_STAAU|nr:hypothetical protein W761_02506 [Staphylococcus aureus VET0798S]EZS14726.1 hypothetical protein W657_02584 [Staphylococcus aureus VET0436R]EZS43028.1 hypothetical protein W572_02664 [Staphylococcus aureus VET0306R]EZS66919.1 hypothetical protein W514_02568 [Staphylococcus aureus VET0219R]EZT00691.1 hypothetical protein W449_02571 [Staphylococcus aureus VET0125R]EZT30860.1 hypothetical protein V126_02499 [Staphylococcus aureus Tur-5]EZT31371.1 hypothetical protein V113_02576 [Staphylococcus